MFNFDEIIDRRNTNAMTTDGFRDYIFHAGPEMTFPYKDEEFIRMWVADMEFATPDVIIDAMRARLDRRIFGYTGRYTDEYYRLFSGWCKTRYNWDFPQEQLVTASGVVQALNELVEFITKPDESVLILTPSYKPFKGAADRSRRGCVCSDLINDGGCFSIDWEDLEAKAAEEKTTLLIFCNPHNPTGRVWTQEELESLSDLIRRHGLWVISDEIHCDLLRQGQRHIPLGKVMPDYERLVTCMAPSKTFNTAGLLMSNIIIRSPALRRVWHVQHHSSENPLSIVAAQAGYEKGAPWLEALHTYLDENFHFAREYLRQCLPQAVFTPSQATYLAWVDLNAYFQPDEPLPLFFAWNAGVLLEGGDAMFVHNAEGFIRLNLACPRATLEAGLRRICQAVNEKHREKFIQPA